MAPRVPACVRAGGSELKLIRGVPVKPHHLYDPILYTAVKPARPEAWKPSAGAGEGAGANPNAAAAGRGGGGAPAAAAAAVAAARPSTPPLLEDDS